jgi:uncharacterized protein DUF4112
MTGRSAGNNTGCREWMRQFTGNLPVRSKEEQTETIGHLLDDAFRLPGTSVRFGLDPLIGLIPVFGDALVTAMGAAILLNAKQLHVPTNVIVRMAYNLAVNGLVGTIPGFGDLFSFWFKSHAKNTALLIRAVGQGEAGACSLTAPPLAVSDFALIMLLTVPIVVFIGFVSFLLWERGITIF